MAVQVTVVWPCGNELPEAGTQVTWSGLPSWSVAVAWKVTGVPPDPAHSAAISPGQTMVGGQIPAVKIGPAWEMSLAARPLL